MGRLIGGIGMFGAITLFHFAPIVLAFIVSALIIISMLHMRESSIKKRVLVRQKRSNLYTYKDIDEPLEYM